MAPKRPAILDGRYELQELLGRGGMGKVYRAMQLGTERAVAVKLLDADSEELQERFRREAKLTALLEHPNAVRVYDFGVSEEGQPYLAMELLRGVELSKEIRQHGKLELERAVDVACQVLQALHHAHQKGVIHRDIKPANIFLHRDESGRETVKVMDFGIARLSQREATNLTVTGAVIGTPSYMSPEQAQGEAVDRRTDIYSVGVVFFQMLTGHTPYKADTPVALAMKLIQEPTPSLTPLRPDLAKRSDVQRTLDCLMAKQAAERPADAQEAIKLLQALVDPTATARFTRIAPSLVKDDTVSVTRTAVPAGDTQLLPPSLPSVQTVPDRTEEWRPSTVEVDLASQLVSRETAPGLPKPVASVPSSGNAGAASSGASRGRGLFGGMAVGLVLVVAGYGWLSHKQTPRAAAVELRPAPVDVAPPLPVAAPAPVAPTPTPPPAPQPPPAAPTTTSVEVRSEPPGAVVELEGSRKGITPMRLQVATSAGVLSLRVHREGYRAATVVVDSQKQRVVDVTLVAEKKPSANSASRPETKAAPSQKGTALELEEF
ncbi:MAG: serine/threonine-protein kinase [Myxococcota bacterium]